MNEIDLIYKELSYDIVGILFEVHNELGASHAEKVYQKAIASALKNQGINFVEQVYSIVEFKGEKVGYYYFDFLIENKIVLEIKRREAIFKS